MFLARLMYVEKTVEDKEHQKQSKRGFIQIDVGIYLVDLLINWRVVAVQDSKSYNWNDAIGKDDDVYMLGEFFLGEDYDFITNTINSLNGRIHLVIGNHDTPAKVALMCRYKFDIDHGIAIVFKDNNIVDVGQQDIIL